MVGEREGKCGQGKGGEMWWGKGGEMWWGKGGKMWWWKKEMGEIMYWGKGRDGNEVMGKRDDGGRSFQNGENGEA